jgi:hypothetical protein
LFYCYICASVYDILPLDSSILEKDDSTASSRITECCLILPLPAEDTGSAAAY